MEFNFVLSIDPKKKKAVEEMIESPAKWVEEHLAWNLISYIFQLYEIYEIKFSTKISSFTVSQTEAEELSGLETEHTTRGHGPRVVCEV